MKMFLILLLILAAKALYSQNIKSITVNNSSVIVAYDSVIQGIEIHSDTLIEKSCVKRYWFTKCTYDTVYSSKSVGFIDTLHLSRKYLKPVEMKYLFAIASLLPVLQINAQVYGLTKYGFGVYYDTTTVIPPVITGVDYGVFRIATVAEPSLAARIHDVKASGATLFRLSYLYGAGYNIQQVADSGLDVELTFNYNQLNVNNGYATDSNAFKTALLTTLASATAKPKYICVRNEFLNWNYWDTSHIDRYVFNELNPAVHIGDSMGIRVADGGFLPNLIYTLFKYYQDNGKTDSTTWLTNQTGITNVNSPAVVRTMAAYNFVLDNEHSHTVYNQHWAEPLSGDTSTLVTTGVLPVLINYVKSRTGRDNLTNEFHTENHSQALLFALCNEYNSTHPLAMEYYSGEISGQPAIDLIDDYRLWLLSLLP